MRRKLGLVEVDGGEEDQELMTDLLQVMHDTGADFTNTFRRLANFPMPTTHPQGWSLHPCADTDTLPCLHPPNFGTLSLWSAHNGEIHMTIISVLRTKTGCA